VLLQNERNSVTEYTQATWPPDRPGVAGLWRLQAVVAVLLAAAMFVRPPAPNFIYDAADYFAGSQALLNGNSVTGAAGLDLRGVLTPFLYLPAALITYVGGQEMAGVAVLAENAVLIALIGAVLLPRLVAIWRPVTPTVVVVTAVGSGVVLAGFAPYPLSDLWGATLLLVTFVALDLRTWPWILAAGLSAGVAVNVRPATLLPLGAVVLALLVARRGAAVWFASGVVVALIPQFLFNRSRGVLGLPVPDRTGWLTELQSTYAPFIVRYDTVIASPGTSPSLSFCSPHMARALEGNLPSSPGELAVTYLTHMPASILMTAQKIGASLHWPLSTPYMTPAPVLNAAFAIVITSVTVIGAAVLLRHALRRGRGLTLSNIVLILAWVGCLLSLITSATETRFALPLVLFGLVGCSVLAADGLRKPQARSARLWIAGTLMAILALYVLGVTGMAHSFPFLASPEHCTVL
jgi:hypothetical protein